MDFWELTFSLLRSSAVGPCEVVVVGPEVIAVGRGEDAVGLLLVEA